jgi:hypothetical protein
MKFYLTPDVSTATLWRWHPAFCSLVPGDAAAFARGVD